MENRSKREKKAYDKGNVFEVSDQYHKKSKVFHYPNTIYHEDLFESLIIEKAQNGRVLDIGCADGNNSENIYKKGADFVKGVDISERWIKEAKKREIPGKLVFQQKDVTNPLKGKFDLIVGRAILHHIDYQKCLKMFYNRNLSDEGSMIFMEPFGENFLMKAFYYLVPEAHTPDESPFYYEDFYWIKENFSKSRFYPFNYLSLSMGIIFSLIDSYVEESRVMTIADKIDRMLAHGNNIIIPRFRQFILVIEK